MELGVLLPPQPKEKCREGPDLLCEVCGLPVKPWGTPGSLQGAHRFIRLHGGKLRIMYFGSVHQECDTADWKKELADAVKMGWLIPNPEGEGFIAAPAYR